MRTIRQASPRTSRAAARPASPASRSRTSTGNKDKPLYDIPFAVERMKAARAAIDKAAPDVMLTGRAEGFIAGVPDLEQMIARLKAYSDAGADVLYAPGIRTREQIEAVCKAVAPKPVNFLNGAAFGHSVSDLASMGVRRISVGGALARSAWGGFIRMAKEIAEQGIVRGLQGRGERRRAQRRSSPRTRRRATHERSDELDGAAVSRPQGARRPLLPARAARCRQARRRHRAAMRGRGQTCGPICRRFRRRSAPSTRRCSARWCRTRTSARSP